MVVTVPPLIAVVPPASVVRLPAVKVPPRVVVPVLLRATVPRAVVPTAPLKAMLPASALMVRSRVVASLSTVEAKVRLLSPRSMVTLFPRVTAPVKVELPAASSSSSRTTAPAMVMEAAVRSRSASGWTLPMEPPKLREPVPAVTVRVRFWVAALSALIVPVKLTLLSAVPSVLTATLAPRTTAPARVAVAPPAPAETSTVAPLRLMVAAVISRSASAWAEPMLVNVVAPVPAATTSLRLEAARSALTAEAKVRLLSVPEVLSVVMVTSVPSATLPVKTEVAWAALSSFTFTVAWLRLMVAAVTSRSASAWVSPTAPPKVTVPAPAWTSREMFSVPALPALIAPVKPMLPPLESTLVAPPDSVSAPKVRPSKPLKVRPSSVTLPARLVPVSPLARVTLPANFRLVAAPAARPELAPTVPWKSTRPVTALLTVSAAPVPVPRLETLPVTVVVPAAMPAARVRFCPPPAREARARLAPPVSRVEAAVRVTAPRSIWVAVVARVPARLVPPVTPVVSRPPVKVSASPASLPRVTVPVLRKLVSAVMVPPALRATL